MIHLMIHSNARISTHRRGWRANPSARFPLACGLIVIFIAIAAADSAGRPRAAASHSPASASPWTAQARYVMGTLLEVQVPADASSEHLLSSLFAIARRHDEIFSTYKADSPVSRFNRASRAHAAFVAPAEMIELTSIARRVTDQTDGAFDVTIGPLVRLWKDAASRRRWPRPGEVAAARSRTGARLVEVDLRAATVTAMAGGIELDFNGIAKGYCVDKMVEAAGRAGVTQALINLGESSVFALGSGRDGRPWAVAVRDPEQPSRAALNLHLSNMAIGSSASYENAGHIAGRKINHIIDPRTGMPADSRRAVTVIAPTATLADALSTAMVVLKPSAALKVLERFPGAEAVIFYRDEAGRRRRALSPGMYRFIQ